MEQFSLQLISALSFLDAGAIFGSVLRLRVIPLSESSDVQTIYIIHAWHRHTRCI